MANLLIKPTTGPGNKVILQDQAGGDILTSADSGATIENATFPTVKLTPTATASAPTGVEGALYYNSDYNEIMSYTSAWGFAGSHSLVRGETGFVKFEYTGSDQTWTVPTGITVIGVALWGGAGGGGYHGNVCYGGAGGFTEGTIAVTPAETMTIMVGCRGTQAQSTTAVYGGGGSRNHTYNTSSGAGRSAIFRGSNSTTLANELATAGGGGGGAEDFPNNNHAGAGGGLKGQDAVYGNTDNAKGGTQTAKGAQVGNANADLSGDRCRGGNATSKPASGGGGGGYFGGGAGAQDESGAGGSGYIGGMLQGRTYQGDANYPPFGGEHPMYLRSLGYNIAVGSTTQASNGTHGRVLIFY